MRNKYVILFQLRTIAQYYTTYGTSQAKYPVIVYYFNILMQFVSLM